MTEEILINESATETRVAKVENGVVQELYIERANKKGLVGNIYRGKVVRVLPGMQAAFIDIGLEKAAFIHANELYPSQDKQAGVVDKTEDSVPNSQISINDLVREGEEIIVQVVKDMIGSKGARLTSQLSIPSRYFVYLPNSNRVGVSQRIEEEAERDRLKKITSDYVANNQEIRGGFIVRTAAESVSEEELNRDLEFVSQKLLCRCTQV